MTTDSEPTATFERLVPDPEQLRKVRDLPGAEHPAAFLHREIAHRLLEHLPALRIKPHRVLDASTVTGSCMEALCRQVSGARILVVAASSESLIRQRGAWRPFDRRWFVGANLCRLPLPEKSIEMIVSNLALHRSPRPDLFLAELFRVLTPGGVLKLSTVGPDTLRELRQSWRSADDHVHVHALPDMHELGDTLARCGLADVVVSSEVLTTYAPDIEAIHADLRALRETCIAPGRNRALTTARRLHAASTSYEKLRTAGGLPVTIEALYAQAWRPAPRSVSVNNPAHCR